MCHVYVLHPPGGVVGGDVLEISVHVGPEAKVLLTTPAAGKFYRSAGQRARVSQHFTVEGTGVLEWLPQENIFHNAARVETSSKFSLMRNAALISIDISCFGLPAGCEDFVSGSCRQRIEIEHDGRPIYVETTRYSPDNGLFEAPWGMGGYCIGGQLLAFPADESRLTPLREQCGSPDGVLSAATLLDGVLSVRCLGNDAETIRMYLQSVWKWLRPRMLMRPAVAPRIWAT